MRKNPYLTLLGWPRARDQLPRRPMVKQMLLVYKTKLEKGVTITSLQIVFCNTHKSVLIHASSKTLCPAANENEKETHSQTLFKDRGLGIHSSK